MLCDTHSYFTNEELAELKRVYTSACHQLGIDVKADHSPLRERVASLVMQLARNGVFDSDAIRASVVDEVDKIGAGASAI